MSEQLVASSIEESVLTLSLNRPNKLNSFIEPMANQLQQGLNEAKTNDKIRCVLLTGKGKAFCAGQDLPEVVDKGEDYELGETVRKSYNPIIKAIRHLEKPVVCAVNGTAAGAGANLALACDIVLASKEAVFVQSFSKIGLIPDSGGTFFLPRLVGLQRANAMYLLDEKISPEKAEEIGLIYKAVETDKLIEETQSICQKLASMPTKGFGLYKRAINRSFSNNLEEHLELEAELQTEAGNTDDYHEGVQSFLEKRKPEFKGK
ncbi:2-(1,2-epoxy-1,2-dihydrophenyl)acetyl-CoA isomerase PaaG [Aliifodinibius salicampi]|uniref:2-(1,2-epoxy-1,2-dihydrophenyl)acetyl-CoA isomerase PaaG n=1 Tax=Fodinibius salicampi TaxID=1920655 RepID=A0ABT3PTW1_9BACT|nr:enoyl-CoA hydratase-related protein [Fodinibius salicampi]MCW9711288.1 2-(1,2-epoxy-1,2-dihydrophenyl)acetyl-CoA isomerase PaaG [Fodinibius salicampi]